MQWITVATNGAILWAGPEPTVTVNPAKARLIPIPDGIRFVGIEDAGVPGAFVLGKCLYSDLPTHYTDEEIGTARAALIDAATGKSISEAVHPFAPVDEQLGILRDQLAQILNALGMKATAGFARLNEIAIAEIQKGRKAKGLAPDGEKTTALDARSGLLSKLVAIAAKKG